MATRTPYYGLTKPAGIEDAQISVINANMDTLDTELHLTTVRDAKNLAPIYDATSSYVEGDYVTYLVTGQSSQDANGYFVFKCIDDTTEPAGNFDTNKWEAVCITDEMGSGGGGGGEGGHIFLDDAGTAMPQRAKAKFEGAYSTDNSTDGITNVAVFRTMSGVEFEQLSDAEKQGMIYVDDETTGTDDKFQPVIYSTQEREIGVWTDGKPLYEKTYVFDIDDLVNGTISSSLMDGQFILDQLSYDMLEMVDAFLTDMNGQNSIKSNSANYANGDNYIRANIQYVSETQKYIIYFKLTYSVANLYNDRDYLKFYFRIQYTKTTDTAGSGQWTPQGVPAVHYSTDEKVIGTWIDGKTLYQRTFVFTTANNDSYNYYTTDIANPETMIIDFSASFYILSSTVCNPAAPYGRATTGDNELQVLLNNVNNVLRIDYRAGTQAQNKSAVITIKYTKSTS